MLFFAFEFVKANFIAIIGIVVLSYIAEDDRKFNEELERKIKEKKESFKDENK